MRHSQFYIYCTDFHFDKKCLCAQCLVLEVECISCGKVLLGRATLTTSRGFLDNCRQTLMKRNKWERVLYCVGSGTWRRESGVTSD